MGTAHSVEPKSFESFPMFIVEFIELIRIGWPMIRIWQKFNGASSCKCVMQG